MRIEINVEDFWFEDGDLESRLKDYVVRKAVDEIFKRIEDKIKNRVFEDIQCLVNNILTKEVNEKVKEFIKEGKTRSRKNIATPISIEERIREDFETDGGWNSTKETVTNLAKKFANDMKNRYDLLFASQLVAKMNEAGMLKPDVAKLLLDIPGAKT